MTFTRAADDRATGGRAVDERVGTGTAESAMRSVVARVRERLRTDGVDPVHVPEQALRVARAEVRQHNDYALARGLAALDDEQASVRQVLAAVSGYGALQAYLDDPTVEELWLNAPDRILSI